MKHKKETYQILPDDTLIELVCIKGVRVIKNTMSLGESMNIEKKGGWIYLRYQIGFSSFEENKSVKK